MIRAGFAVPPGFVLTTVAYDTFVDEHELQQQIVALASKAAVDNPQSSEEASLAIQNLFQIAEIPENIQANLYCAPILTCIKL